MRSAVLVVAVAVLSVTGVVAVPGVAPDAGPGPLPAVDGPGEQRIADPGVAADFGYASMTVDGEPARGVRPLVVVVIESPPAANASGVAHPTSYYERLVFGYGDTGVPTGGGNASVRELFIENSRGRFTWSMAGGKVYGPITYPSNGAFVEAGGFDGDEDFDTRRAAPQLLADRGFDFTAYDRDDDGEISRDELGLLVFDDRSVAGGQTIRFCQQVDQPEAGKIRVCMEASGVGHRAALSSVVAHELGHQVGVPHHYGADGRLESRTVMGPNTGVDDLSVFHLDPWAKIQLGWVRPRVYSLPALRERGQCAYTGRLSTSESPGGEDYLYSDRDSRTPIILYDPARYDPATGTGEYYLLESRYPVSYDRDGADAKGVAVWYLQTEDGLPVFLPALIRGEGPSAFDDGSLDSEPAGDDVRQDDRILPGPNGVIDTTVPEGPDGKALDVDPIPTDPMNLVIAPGAPAMGAPWNYSQRESYGLWRERDGEARLRWFDDRFIGIPIAVEEEYVREWSYAVNLNTREMHIDAGPTGTVTAAPGADLRLTGHFAPESMETVVRITRGGTTVAELDRPGAGVGLWNCGELYLNLPNDLEYGEYELYAYDPATDTRSDPVTLEVRADLAYETWFGTYEGRLDGRPAEMTIEPSAEFDVAIELRDLERGVTYRGTATGSPSNLLRDVTLRSDAGGTRHLDALYRQGPDRLSGHAEWRGDPFGFAFSTDGTEWESSGRGLAAGHAAWSAQWPGRYRGYLDEEPATLRVLDGAFAELGYVYDVELVDSEGIVYRGRGAVLLDSPHVMRFGRPLANTTSFTLGASERGAFGAFALPGTPRETTLNVASVRLPQLQLHTWDTNYVSGWTATERYGSGLAGAYFVRREPPGVPLAVGDLVASYNANADRVPERARAAFANQRIELVVTSTDYPLDRTTGARQPREYREVYGLVTGDSTIERVSVGEPADPTLRVRVRASHLDAVVEADDPGRRLLDYYRSGVIEVRPVSLTERLTLGVGRVVSNLAKRVGGDEPAFPSPAVKRLADRGAHSRNGGLVRPSEVTTLADDAPVSGFDDVGGLKEDLRRDGDGADRHLRAMRAGASLTDTVRRNR